MRELIEQHRCELEVDEDIAPLGEYPFLPIAEYGSDRVRLYHEFNAISASEEYPFRYFEIPQPSLHWGARIFDVSAIAKRWNFPNDSTEWDWNSVSRYRISVGKQEYLCVEAGFSGLGKSGSLASFKAVLVLTPGASREKLYFSGWGASCESVGSFTGDGRLGYVRLDRRNDHGDESAIAKVTAVAGYRKTVPFRRYRLVQSMDSDRLVVEPFEKPG